jgi:hypothetical protein
VRKSTSQLHVSALTVALLLGIRLAAGTYALTNIDNNTNGPNGLPSIASTLTIDGGADGATLALWFRVPNERVDGLVEICDPRARRLPALVSEVDEHAGTGSRLCHGSR